MTTKERRKFLKNRQWVKEKTRQAMLKLKQKENGVDEHES